MSQIPTAEQNPDGLHQRYNVTKVNGEPIDHLATYFVLRLDGYGKDGLHIHASRIAAKAYADTIQELGDEDGHLAKVASQLQTLLENLNKFD